MSRHRDRLATHAAVSASLAARSDLDLLELLSRRRDRRAGIGGSTQVVRVDGEPVFVKVIRVTDLEREAGPGCTENLFNLPSWYQYGVGEGSTGFNVWREVAAHRTASDWVRDGQSDNFPLLYHWRELPRPDLGGPTLGPIDIGRAVSFWGGSRAVETRLRALTGSSSAVALFLEHVPFALRSWLIGQLTAGSVQARSATAFVERHLLGAADHMRRHGLSHFDAHFDNVLTDGHRIYVSDFGLATSPQFQLDPAEREFVALTCNHDVAYCVTALVNTISGTLVGFDGPRERNDYVRHCSISGKAAGLTGSLADTVVRYARVGTIVNDFYWQLWDGELTADYPATPLAAALDRAGMPS